MIIYTIIISLALIVVSLLSYFVGFPLYDLTLIDFIKYTGLSILSVVLIDGLLALIIHHLPSKWFNYQFKRFHIFKFERRFYDKIKIKKWKDHIPELGGLADFRKNKVSDPTNNEYVEKFLTECCYGEVIHFMSIFLGFLVILYWPRGWYIIGLHVGIANGIINLLSFMILRYNRPKLMVLHERNRRNQLRNKRKEEDLQSHQNSL